MAPGFTSFHPSQLSGQSGVMLTPRPRTVWIVAALIVVAAPLRFAHLGSLSFYADEETSAMAALSWAEGHGSYLPSGLEYRRALPFTVLNGVSARLFGTDREVPYRIPAALLGTVTVPTLFLVGRAFVGGPAAAVAAGLLAVSEWHLAFSRQSRMYVPFLLFFILAAWAIWTWARRDDRARWLVVAAVAFAAVSTLHTLSLFAVLFALLPLSFPGVSKRAPWKLIAFALVAAAGAYLYTKYYVLAAYVFPTNPGDPTPLATGRVAAPEAIAEAESGWLTVWTVLKVVVGSGLGLWTAGRSRLVDNHAGAVLRAGVRLLTAMAAGAFVCLGHLYGAVLCALGFLMLQPDPRRALWARVRMPASILGVIGGWQMVLAGTRFGPVDGVKSLTAFPFPYPAFLAMISPGIVLLFAVAATALAFTRVRPEEVGVRACVLATIVPLAALGVVSEWGATRYLLPVYPFLLLVAAYGLTQICKWLADRVGLRSPAVGYGAAIAIAATGLLGGHGIPQAKRIVTLAHGQPVNELVHMFPFRPDHAQPGAFVRAIRDSNDVIIAEDPLEQWWYAGGVDYWLRSYGDAARFVYRAADGHVRDMYVNSRLLTQRPRPRKLLGGTAGRVWLITSGETQPVRQYYLNGRQRMWLDSLERTRTPAFTGRDGVTRVYCLNCPDGTSE